MGFNLTPSVPLSAGGEGEKKERGVMTPLKRPVFTGISSPLSSRRTEEDFLPHLTKEHLF
jgi:hypothetical protein